MRSLTTLALIMLALGCSSGPEDPCDTAMDPTMCQAEREHYIIIPESGSYYTTPIQVAT